MLGGASHTVLGNNDPVTPMELVCIHKLKTNVMFSETEKQIQKQYKITSSHLFFNYMKSTFNFFLALDAT